MISWIERLRLLVRFSVWFLYFVTELYDECNQGIDLGCSMEINTCDWMAKFPDSTKLVHMNLPGTHDTSTCWVSGISFAFFILTNFVIFQGTTQMSPRPLSPVLLASRFYFNSPWTPEKPVTDCETQVSFAARKTRCLSLLTTEFVSLTFALHTTREMIPLDFIIVSFYLAWHHD